jgi:hypothetical protein
MKTQGQPRCFRCGKDEQPLYRDRVNLLEVHFCARCKYLVDSNQAALEQVRAMGPSLIERGRGTP